MTKRETVRRRAATKPTVGKELARRLGRFVEALESTDDPAARFTCRTITLNLEPHAYGAEEVKRVRKILNVSQAIFARFAGVSVAAVRDWEQNLKPPGGAVRRLMDEIVHNPAYFQKRLRELSSPVGDE